MLMENTLLVFINTSVYERGAIWSGFKSESRETRLDVKDKVPLSRLSPTRRTLSALNQLSRHRDDKQEAPRTSGLEARDHSAGDQSVIRRRLGFLRGLQTVFGESQAEFIFWKLDILFYGRLSQGFRARKPSGREFVTVRKHLETLSVWTLAPTLSVQSPAFITHPVKTVWLLVGGILRKTSRKSHINSSQSTRAQFHWYSWLQFLLHLNNFCKSIEMFQNDTVFLEEQSAITSQRSSSSSKVTSYFTEVVTLLLRVTQASFPHRWVRLY